MNGTGESPDWLKSSEVQKELHIESCELMHLREAGRLRFTTKGNAFLYLKADVMRVQKSKQLVKPKP